VTPAHLIVSELTHHNVPAQMVMLIFVVIAITSTMPLILETPTDMVLLKLDQKIDVLLVSVNLVLLNVPLAKVLLVIV